MSNFAHPWFNVLRGSLAVWIFTSALLVPLTAAEPVVTRLPDADQIRLQPGQNAAVFEFSSARAPSSSSGAVIEGRTGQYVHWSTPLQRQGNFWRAQIPPDRIPSLLTFDQLIARFPGAAEANADLHVMIPRDRYVPAMESVQALVPNAPLFFAPPAAPERPEVPQPNVARPQAEDFISKALIFDLKWSTYMSEFSAARSRAHGLFLDLRTSGRIPWSADVLDRLFKHYEGLTAQQTQIENTRTQWQATARQFVQQWNAANSGQPPLELTFVDPS